MERRVKERLVGATILVVLIVLIVPELLSGPKRAPPPPNAPHSGPLHSYTIDVESHATATVDAASSHASASAPDASAPAPSVPAASAVAPASAAPPSTLPIAPSAVDRSAADLHSNEAAPKFDRAWSVQLGSFASADHAGAFAREMRTKGFATYVSKTAENVVRFRVRVGPFADREAALRLQSQLKAKGQAATVVSPGN
jgi:DedD protein